MGLFNWLLKNGPGSPGSTAKVFVNFYKLYKVENHYQECDAVFRFIFSQRYLACKKIGFAGGCLLNVVDAENVIFNSDSDLPLFT